MPAKRESPKCRGVWDSRGCGNSTGGGIEVSTREGWRKKTIGGGGIKKGRKSLRETGVILPEGGTGKKESKITL